MRRLIVSGLLALLAASPARALAQGGPPLVTDDPDTPGPGYWEINLAAIVTRSAIASSADLPRLDINYGVGDRVQLKFEAPWVRVRDDGGVNSGAGELAGGVKYRFLGQEGRLVAWSVYPQVEFGAPRSSVAKGLAEGGTALFLPSELTIEIAHVEVNGEAGRRLASHGPGGWEYGVSTEGHVLSRLELLGEIHAAAADHGHREILANLGARPKLTRQIVLLLAAGRAITRGGERPRLLFYGGVQFNIPNLYAFTAPTDVRPIGRTQTAPR